MNENRNLESIYTLENLVNKINLLTLKIKILEHELIAYKDSLKQLNTITKAILGELIHLRKNTANKADLELLKTYSKLKAKIEARLAIYGVKV